MLGNIVDHRTDSLCPECDAVFEPSAHDNTIRPDGQPWFHLDEATSSPAYFTVESSYDTTVREAVLRAETEWPFPVTVFIYDQGSRPLG
jgi:hypothetical protein